MRADAVSGRGSPAGAGRPAVAVVVPIGSADDLARMGAALAQIRRVQGDEVVVVDNTRQQRLATPSGRGVLVRAPLERSSYYARNVGAAATSAPWLLFIDSDCEPRPDLLERYFDPDPASDVGIVAGDVRAADAGHSLAERWGRSRRLLNVEYHLHRGPHPAGATANLLVSRRCWEALGGFQEGLRSAADLEFCWRAQDAGFGFEFRPGATVTHSNPDSIRRLLAKARRYGAGQLWVDRRYPGASPRPAL